MTTRFTRASILLDPDKSLAYDIYTDQATFVDVQFDHAPAGTTFEMFLELEDGSGALVEHSGPMGGGYKGGSKKGSVCKPGKGNKGSDKSNKGQNSDKGNNADCPWPTGVFAMIKTIPPAAPGDGVCPGGEKRSCGGPVGRHRPQSSVERPG